MKRLSFSRCALAVAIGAAWTIAPQQDAHAAEAPARAGDPASSGQANPQAAESQVLETVTVSSEKAKGFRTKLVQVGAFRDQQALDVPMTVNVLPRDLLDAQAASGLFDALKNAAGVSRSQVGGGVNDNLSIRGINVDNRTSYRLNGSLPINNLTDLPLENKERVEALKGSSALYYGFTSPAGIVNLVTKRAGLAPVSMLNISGNEYGQLLGHLDLGRKFGEDKQFGARVNLVGGKVSNSIDGGKGNRRLASIALDWNPTEELSFRFDYEDLYKEIPEQAGIALLSAVNNVIALPRLPDPKRLLSGTWAMNAAGSKNVLFRADYGFSSKWTATVELGRAATDRDERNFGQLINYNLATGAGTLSTSLTRGQQYRNSNSRLELNGRESTGPLDHELTLGYTQNKRYQNGPSAQRITQAQNLYDPLVLAAPTFSITPTLNPQDVVDKGLYVFDRIRLGSQWQLLAGIRQEDYESISSTARYTIKKNTLSGGVVYRLRPDTSVYANYIEGLEETGTAPISAANAFEVLPPSVSKQNELGIRTDVIPGMSASLAYFEIERASAYINTSNVFVLDGRANYRGVEFSVNGEVASNLSVYVSGMLMDVEIKSAANAALIGKTPENTAKKTLSVFAEYRPVWLLAGLAVNAGAFYTSARPVNNLNQAHIPGYTLFNLGARFSTRIAGTSSTFQVNVENAANKRYWNAAGGNLLGQGLSRMVKASARFDF